MSGNLTRDEVILLRLYRYMMSRRDMSAIGPHQVDAFFSASIFDTLTQKGLLKADRFGQWYTATEKGKCLMEKLAGDVGDVVEAA